MMAFGQWTFGLTPFGWRFSAAVVGTVAILILARITRRMTRSTMLGCIAGLLLALDGLELVLSRTAILDIFLMFWVLAAFGLLVIDRDRAIARLTEAAAGSGPHDLAGPRLGIRWLRVAAGLCIGAACATKWSGIWFLLGFACLAIAWDIGARRAAGYSHWLAGGLRSEGKWLPVWFGLAPLVVYVASWSGWFATSNGYDRNWAAAERQPHPRVVHDRFLVPVQPLDAPVRPRAALAAVLQVQPGRLARAGPAYLVLLVLAHDFGLLDAEGHRR